MALLLAVGTKLPHHPRDAAGRIAFFESSFLSFMAAIFFLAVSYGGITTFLPLFAASIKVNPATFFLVYSVSLTLVRPVAGKLSDRLDEVFVVVPALMVTISALLVLSFSNGLMGVTASAVLYGIGFGAAQHALQAAILRFARPDRKGVANVSFFTAFDLGIGLGSILLGWVSQYAGYPALFMVSAVSVVVSLLIFAFYTRRKLLPSPDKSEWKNEA